MRSAVEAYSTAGTQFRLWKYLAGGDTCFCLPSSQAWLLGTAFGTFLRGFLLPHPQAAGFRCPLTILRGGVWLRPQPSEAKRQV